MKTYDPSPTLFILNQSYILLFECIYLRRVDKQYGKIHQLYLGTWYIHDMLIFQLRWSSKVAVGLISAYPKI